jgi:hypothetical protein
MVVWQAAAGGLTQPVCVVHPPFANDKGYRHHRRSSGLRPAESSLTLLLPISSPLSRAPLVTPPPLAPASARNSAGRVRGKRLHTRAGKHNPQDYCFVILLPIPHRLISRRVDVGTAARRAGGRRTRADERREALPRVPPALRQTGTPPSPYPPAYERASFCL